MCLLENVQKNVNWMWKFWSLYLKHSFRLLFRPLLFKWFCVTSFPSSVNLIFLTLLYKYVKYYLISWKLFPRDSRLSWSYGRKNLIWMEFTRKETKNVLRHSRCVNFLCIFCLEKRNLCAKSISGEKGDRRTSRLW